MDKPNTENSGIRPGVIVAIVAVVGVLVAGKMLDWFGGAKPPADQNIAETPATPDDTTASHAASVSDGTRIPRPGTGPDGVPSSVPLPRAAATVPGVRPGAGAPAPDLPATPETPDAAMADWSAKLDDVLGSDADEGKKADQLLAIWKTLPEEGQIETMQHISNLLTDEKFPALLPAFTNAATPEAVLDIIMTDALNRPNGMKLPALLDVAKTPGHPKAEEARDILEVFVDANHGTDWTKWDKAVQDWLKENPDEPEPGK